MAETLLPNKGYWKGDKAGRVTAASAAAMLGKSYLYRSGIEPLYGHSQTTYYNEAAAAFDRIIRGDYGTFRLVEYSHNFDVAHENNDESILGYNFSEMSRMQASTRPQPRRGSHLIPAASCSRVQA